ncbi:arrestin domain-containing protein 17-like [Saccostrea echinata]|uniref:arrestin domain-containing protein 17-like n=1 Tax=Saccostrea echinata TaxID=191078 RepID=UPI002A80C7B2|nr:arrestin domain-containing protein 17-like [Saccostrea echinata]
MGKLQVYKIEFDELRAVYKPGQNVTGRLIVELDMGINVREIQMKCVGWGEVHWTRKIQSGGPGQKQKTETIHFNGEENYFRSVLALYGKVAETGEWLPQGRHIFHFSFTLPPMLPSSYNDKFGNIVYEVSAILDLDFWSTDQIIRKEFKVVSDVDLNRYPGAEASIEIQNFKYVCCWCCKSGPITGILRTSKTGYVSGEPVVFDITIQNRSRRVCGVSVVFLKETIYHAKGEKKVCVSEIKKSQYEDVMPGEIQTWDDEEFDVPSVPPPCLEGCKLITIDHYLKLVIDPAGPAFHLTVPLKLIIGSIPSYGTYRMFDL